MKPSYFTTPKHIKSLLYTQYKNINLQKCINKKQTQDMRKTLGLYMQISKNFLEIAKNQPNNFIDL